MTGERCATTVDERCDEQCDYLNEVVIGGPKERQIFAMSTVL
jgi:hypothetical protein